MEIQSRISLRKNKLEIGRVHKGLVIDYDVEEDLYLLRSYWNAPDDIDGSIYFSSDKPLEEGSEVEVIIEDCDNYNLYGKLLEK